MSRKKLIEFLKYESIFPVEKNSVDDYVNYNIESMYDKYTKYCKYNDINNVFTSLHFEDEIKRLGYKFEKYGDHNSVICMNSYCLKWIAMDIKDADMINLSATYVKFGKHYIDSATSTGQHKKLYKYIIRYFNDLYKSECKKLDDKLNNATDYE